MARPKAQPTQPKAQKPDPRAVQQVAGEVTARLEAEHGQAPEGGAAALRLPAVDWGRIVPQLVTPLLEVASMGADGRIDADEARRIAAIVFEAIGKVRSGA